jgi:hypothetical protein
MELSKENKAKLHQGLEYILDILHTTEKEAIEVAFAKE